MNAAASKGFFNFRLRLRKSFPYPKKGISSLVRGEFSDPLSNGVVEEYTGSVNGHWKTDVGHGLTSDP